MRAPVSFADRGPAEAGAFDSGADGGVGPAGAIVGLKRVHRMRGVLAIVYGATLLAGCGGGAPLLHGAHALSPGVISGGAGFSSTFATGDPRRATESSPGNATRARAAEGASVVAALAPSVAPWFSGRVGLEGDNEAGITYFGRGARVDVRHAFESGDFAWSAGIGASTLFSGSDQTTSFAGPDPKRPPRFQLALGSFGLDVPLLVGWRSDAGIVSAWAGARGGYERITGRALPLEGEVPEPPLVPEMTGSLSLHREYAGGVVGFAVGFRHVHVAFELDTYYQWVGGDYADTSVKINGLTLTPSGALLFTF